MTVELRAEQVDALRLAVARLRDGGVRHASLTDPDGIGSVLAAVEQALFTRGQRVKHRIGGLGIYLGPDRDISFGWVLFDGDDPSRPKRCSLGYLEAVDG